MPLTEDNFNLEENNYKSYAEFKQVVENLGVDPKYFFKDEENPINRYWYIESFITIPFFNITEDMLKFCNLGETVRQRKYRIKTLLEQKNYETLLTLVDKPLRIHCLKSIIDTIPKEQFKDVFKLVWSSIESSYTSLSEPDVLDRLRESKNTTIEDLIKQGAIIDNKTIVTIYRGENEASNHYLNGALSWTLDYDVAKFFAARFGKPNQKIYKAKVNVEDILMYIKKEKEILIERHNLKDIEEINL